MHPHDPWPRSPRPFPAGRAPFALALVVALCALLAPPAPAQVPEDLWGRLVWAEVPFGSAKPAKWSATVAIKQAILHPKKDKAPNMPFPTELFLDRGGANPRGNDCEARLHPVLDNTGLGLLLGYGPGVELSGTKVAVDGGVQLVRGLAENQVAAKQTVFTGGSNAGYFYPSVSFDGRTAFATKVSYSSSEGLVSELAKVDITKPGGLPQLFGSPAVRGAHPAPSPDGKMLAYVETDPNDPRTQRLVIASLSDLATRYYELSAPYGRRIVHPVWRADSGAVAFGSDWPYGWQEDVEDLNRRDYPDCWNVFVLKLDPSLPSPALVATLRSISGDKLVNVSKLKTVGIASWPAFSADGKYVAYCLKEDKFKKGCVVIRQVDVSLSGDTEKYRIQAYDGQCEPAWVAWSQDVIPPSLRVELVPEDSSQSNVVTILPGEQISLSGGNYTATVKFTAEGAHFQKNMKPAGGPSPPTPAELPISPDKPPVLLSIPLSKDMAYDNPKGKITTPSPGLGSYASIQGLYVTENARIQVRVSAKDNQWLRFYPTPDVTDFTKLDEDPCFFKPGDARAVGPGYRAPYLPQVARADAIDNKAPGVTWWWEDSKCNVLDTGTNQTGFVPTGKLHRGRGRAQGQDPVVPRDGHRSVAESDRARGTRVRVRFQLHRRPAQLRREPEEVTRPAPQGVGMRWIGAAVALMLLGSLLWSPSARAQSILDWHGPDGLSFTEDDPLRVAAGSHPGVFFVSLNGMNDSVQDPPDSTTMGFLNLQNWTVCEIKPFTGTNWGTETAGIDGGSPGKAPPAWSSQQTHPCYLSGCGLLHQIIPNPASRDNYAVRLDPSSLGSGAIPDIVKEIRFEAFSLDRVDTLGMMDLDAGSEAMCGRFKLRCWAVHVHIVIDLWLFKIDMWIKLGDTPSLPDSAKTEISGLITSYGLDAIGVTADKIIAGANAGGTCAAVTTSSTPTADQCTKMEELMAKVKEGQDQLNGPGNMPASLVQDVIDVATAGGTKWMDWTDPYGGATKDVVDNIVGNNKLKDKIKKFLYGQASPPGGALPVYSGAYMFNSLFFYGPKGKWLVDRVANPTNDADKGLIEEFAYARIHRLDPSELFFNADNIPCAPMEHLDLIRVKNSAVAARIPWPPGAGAPKDVAEKAIPAWGNGACQIIGDAAAIGGDDSTSAFPNELGFVIMAVTPMPDGKLRYANYYRFMRKGTVEDDVEEIPWNPGPSGTGELPLPPNWGSGGQTTRLFTVGVDNHVVPHDKSQTPQVGEKAGTPTLGRQFQYNWDFDGNGEIDSNFGRAIRTNSNGTGCAVCFIVSADTTYPGETGIGQTVLK